MYGMLELKSTNMGYLAPHFLGSICVVHNLLKVVLVCHIESLRSEK